VAKPDNTAVDAAFEILLEEIGKVIEKVKESGSRAFFDEKLDVAQQIISQVKDLTDFRSKVEELRRQWGHLYAAQGSKVRRTISKRDRPRLSKGLRTPERDYYVPILRALSDMGGRGKIGEVLDRVYEITKNVLKPVDLEPLASDPKTPRWRNAVCWARRAMVEEGLLKADSPRGVWEITEAGYDWLKNNVAPIDA